MPNYFMQEERDEPVIPQEVMDQIIVFVVQALIILVDFSFSESHAVRRLMNVVEEVERLYLSGEAPNAENQPPHGDITAVRALIEMARMSFERLRQLCRRKNRQDEEIPVLGKRALDMLEPLTMETMGIISIPAGTFDRGTSYPSPPPTSSHPEPREGPKSDENKSSEPSATQTTHIKMTTKVQTIIEIKKPGMDLDKPDTTESTMTVQRTLETQVAQK